MAVIQKESDLRFVFAADIHASNSHLASLLEKAVSVEADCLIIGGDLIPHYLPESYGSDVLKAQVKYLNDVLVPAFAEFGKSNIPVFLDLGNDDFVYARKVLEEFDGDLFHLLHMRVIPLTDEIDIAGYMNVPPTPFGRKDWEKPDSDSRPFNPGDKVLTRGYVSGKGFLEKHVLDLSSGDTIETDLEALSKKIEKQFVFVAHSPPRNTPLDMLYDGRHAGSESIGRFIEKWSEKEKLIASFHGHIHESPYRSGLSEIRIGNAVCVNPGQNAGPDAELRYAVFELARAWRVSSMKFQDGE